MTLFLRSVLCVAVLGLVGCGDDSASGTGGSGGAGASGGAGTGGTGGSVGGSGGGGSGGTAGVGTGGSGGGGAEPSCSDGVDNDNDGKIDYPLDLECNTPMDSTEDVDGDGFPTEATTGWEPTGVTLSAYTGPSTISTDGTTIDSMDITTCITVTAANVTIKRSRVRCDDGNGTWVINHKSGENLLIEDTEVGSITPPVDPTWCPTCTTRAINQATSASMTVRRALVHHTEAGIAADGGNVLVEYSFVGGNANRAENPTANDQHTTAFKSNGGTNNVTGRFNTLRCEPGTNCSSSISWYEDFGVNDGLLVEGNLIAADAGYCMYGWQPVSSNFEIIHNRFSTEFNPDCGSFGYAVNNQSPPGGISAWWDNRWYDKSSSGNKNQGLVDTNYTSAACNDGIDNDGDGVIDLQDSDCTSATDDTEG